jgi:oligopeptide/dipeptide ABC transporter ATP-binding protein
MGEARAILDVRDLRTYFYLDEGVVKAVDGVDFTLRAGQSLGIVGESGCGKSVTAQSIMQIVPSPGRIVSGRIRYQGSGEPVDIAELKPDGRRMRSIRGKEITMIFQEPMNSLSPVHTIGSQIVESVRLHEGVGRFEAEERTTEMLAKVRIPRPREALHRYPYELSGGMRQRAMIALALICNPVLLIADEPTTALDVTVQAQILRLIRDLQREFETALILITHDLGIVAQTVDRVAVVYLGKVVEYGSLRQVFKNPLHPYTQALFDSVPTLDTEAALKPIAGSVPDPYETIHGCPFRDRCTQAIAVCRLEEIPGMIEVEEGHTVRCYRYGEGESARG